MDATRQLDPRGRAALLDRLYQRISALDDSSLAQLNLMVTSPEDTVEIPVVVEEDGGAFSRRAFIALLLLGGTAATLGGGAAAVLLNQPAQPASSAEAVPTTPPLPATQPAEVVQPTPGIPVYAQQRIRDLETQLGEANADRLALQAQLDTAQAEVNTLNTEVNSLNAEVTTLNTDLAGRDSEITRLQQVIGVYEQLEAIGLDGVIQAGMTPLALAIIAIQNGRALLETGVQDAAARLATVEVQSPGLANGLLWLETQVANLARGLQDLEDALSSFVEPVAPLATQIGDFFGQLLDMLPFGIGQPIRAALDAIANLLTHIPELVASINPMLITPLRQWVSPNDDEGLVANVVRPISSNLIGPAQQVVTDAASLQTTYDTDLRTPVEAALARRAALRTQLVALADESA